MIKQISILSDPDVGNRPQEHVHALPDDLGSGKIYYVSNDGCDLSDGLTPQTAWRSVERVNSLVLQPGDSVLLRRGDVFYGAHLELHGSGDAKSGRWITIDAYGEGEDPRLLGAVKNGPAISLQHASVKGGYRIRHLQIDGYHLGIAAVRGSAAQMLEDIEISYCTIRNVTTGREFDPEPNLPCGAPLAFGMWLHYVRSLSVHHVTLRNTDCPFQFCGGHALFDRLDISDSHIQGVMIYGVRDVHTYEEIMAADGYVTLQNSRILYTGDRATKFGSTGCLIENIHHCRLFNVEVGYTVNTLGIFDACAVDWEQSNVACCFEQVLAHDNQGPFVLAMEHPESAGISRENVIKDCVSYHNGAFGAAAGNSFIDYSSYRYEHQRIRIEGCVDVAQDGVAPYVPKAKEQALHADRADGVFPLDIVGLETYTFAVAECFNCAKTEIFASMKGGTIYNGSLVLHAGDCVRTRFVGQDYCTDLQICGEASIGVRCFENGDRYEICLRGHEAELVKVVSGKSTLLKREACNVLEPHGWNRVVIECHGDTLTVQINRLLIMTATDADLADGAVCIFAWSTCSLGAIRVTPSVSGLRQREQFFGGISALENGSFLVNSAHGEYGFFSPEINWEPLGLLYWEYRPFRTGWGAIGSHGAALSTGSFELDASEVKGARVVMLNVTLDPRVYLEYTEDGEQWQKIAFLTSCASDTTLSRSLAWYPQMRAYDVDLRDRLQVGSKIRGLRLSFGAGCGIIALQGVTFYTAKEKG